MTDHDEITKKYIEKIRSPITAIRAHCVQCMGGQVQHVKGCTAKQCPLYEFRLGRNPFRKHAGNVDHLKAYQNTKKPRSSILDDSSRGTEGDDE